MNIWSTVRESYSYQLFTNQVIRSFGGPRVAINLKQAKNKIRLQASTVTKMAGQEPKIL